MPNEETLKLSVELETAKTLGDLKNLTRQIDDFRKKQILGSKEAIDASNLLAKARNEVNKANALAISDNGKMMKSYFELGQKIRQAQSAAIDLSKAIGTDLSGALGVFAGGPISAFLAAIALSITKMKEANLEVAKLQASAVGSFLGEVDVKDLSKLNRVLAAAKTRRASLLGQSELFRQAYKGGQVIDESGRPMDITVATERLTQMQQQVQLEDEFIKQLTEEKTKQEELNKAREEGMQIGLASKRIDASSDTGLTLGGARRGLLRSYLNYGNQGVYEDIGLGIQSRAYKIETSEQQSIGFNKELEKTPYLAQLAGSSISIYMGGALNGILGQAGALNNLFAGIITGLAGYGLSFIPGVGPFIAAGLGVSGGGSLTGGRTTGTIQSGTARGGGGGSQVVYVQGVLSGQDILIATQRASSSQGRTALP